MSYYLIPALERLRDDVNRRYPRRDKTSDGWIGDASHRARPSSHNPDYSRGGAVRALDVDVDDNDPTRDLRAEVLKATIGDPRVWYVISNGVIYSRTHGWQPRRYTGSNPHRTHVHVSAVEDPAKWRDTSGWFAAEKRRTRAPAVSLSNMIRQFRIGAGIDEGELKPTAGVRRIQRALNHVYRAGLKVDGYAGPNTWKAWTHHETFVGGTHRAKIPDRESLTVLARGRFRVVR